ncbi:MAG: helix-turn-helix domain-containing protein [Nitrospiria bacterium]
METLGEFLQEMRQQRGLTLEEVASQTRISLRLLKALEANDFVQMPNEVSVRGFIRSYARCLGLNEGEVFKKFRESAHDFYAKTPVTAKSRELSTKSRDRKGRAQKLIIGTALFGAAVILGIAFYQQFPFVSESPTQESISPQETGLGYNDPPKGETSPIKDQAEETHPYPVDLTVNIPGLSPGEDSSAVPGPQEGSASGGEDLTLVIEAAERSWILAEIDEHLVKEVLLQPGEKIRWRAKTRFVLTLGNAGGVKLKFNGKTLGPSGPMGKVVRNIVLTR